MRVYEKLFIGGRWVDPVTDEVLEVRSPHDRSLVGRAPHASCDDVDLAVAAAREAFDNGDWPTTSPAERAAVTGGGIAAQTDAYLRAAETFGWEEPIGSGSLIRREPIGVVAAIIPWNAPHQSALAKLVPALLAGNAVILKPSPETALDAFVLGELFAEAELPEGVLSILPAGRETSEYLVSHPGIDKIAFTGSTAAGRRIAAIAGEQLKRVSLELGGKSASIVLDDADVEATVEGLRMASLVNNGESCVAHTRILAPRSRYDEVVAALKEMVESVTVGDPADPETYIGPMVRADQQQRVRFYIGLGIEEGARLVTGGTETPEGLDGGYYVRPTLFADVDNAMRIAQEEIFGPVLVVIPYDDEDDAVAAPFGGYKASGIGREFGAAGLEEYVELKAIAA